MTREYSIHCSNACIMHISEEQFEILSRTPATLLFLQVIVSFSSRNIYFRIFIVETFSTQDVYLSNVQEQV